jgi:NAD+ synthase (glutamine-hydrolysing)
MVFIMNRFVLEGSRSFNVSYIYTKLLGNEAGRVIYDGDAMIASNNKILASSSHCINIAFEYPVISASELSKEEEFSHAVSLSLFDYLRKSRAQGFVVSLSGGADSSDYNN